jgi:D-ribulokinase
MTEAVLGIDIGTSGVRIAARGRNGSLLSMSQAAMASPILEFGRVLQDPQIWWNALELAFAGLDLKDIEVLALAVDGTSGTILPIDNEGNPVGLGSMYNDLAGPAFVNRVASAAPRDTAALGGTSPLARALMMPLNFARVVHQADWIMGRLSGVFDKSDENSALKSGYDPVKRAWPAWISDTGFDLSLWPKVVAAGTRVGTVLPGIADRLKLPGDVAVVTGTTDGCAAFLASGATRPGDGVTSLGTTLTLKLLSSRPVFAPEYGIYSHRIGDQWLAGGASNTGGLVIQQHFNPEQVAALTQLLDPSAPTGFDYYPLPKAGERFPINDASMQPRMTPRPPEGHVFFQAILEGISAIEALGYRRLAELGASPLASIRSVGGGAGNDKWTSIRLKALAVPALPSSSEHAAMGTARLAWRGIGHED